MRLLLFLILTAGLGAAEPVRAIATFGSDPGRSLVVRLLDRAVPPGLVLRDAAGTPVPSTARQHPIGNTGWSVSELQADGLVPGARYQVVDAAGRVLLATDTQACRLPLTFVGGGDLMHTPSLLEAGCRVAAACEPAFALVGGDWAYDNADLAAFDRWLDLLEIWTRTMRRRDGSAIPVLPVIGNHETHDGQVGEAYAAFFPDPTHAVADLGPGLSLVLLDSGHARSVLSQGQWLKEVLTARRDRGWTIAAYHVPAYPSVRGMDDWGSDAIREFWVPQFEAQGVDLALEHHDHALKRTHPLIAGRRHPEGITYLGDGAWGVGARPVAGREARPWLASSLQANHIWRLDLSATAARCTAIGHDGEQLDAVTVAPRP